MGLFIFNSKDCLEDSFSTFHKSGQVHRKITSEQLAGCRGKPASSSELAGSQYLELPIPTPAPQGDVWPWDHGQRDGIQGTWYTDDTVLVPLDEI